MRVTFLCISFDSQGIGFHEASVDAEDVLLLASPVSALFLYIGHGLSPASKWSAGIGNPGTRIIS